MPLQFRRGVDSDRLTITPSVAEPVFTTDTKKLFIGDGSTAGGIEISGSVDSAATIALIDSAYVQARSPLTTTADFPDSAGVNTLIDTRVNATFINNLTIDADTLGGQAGSHYLNYNNFTNTPTIPTFGTDFIDSAAALTLIGANSLAKTGGTMSGDINMGGARIVNAERLGIGTAAPASGLHVIDSVGTYGQVRISDGTNNVWHRTDSSEYRIDWFSSVARKINLLNSGSGSISVGINTPSPTQTLDVAGTLNVTGATTLGSTLNGHTVPGGTGTLALTSDIPTLGNSFVDSAEARELISVTDAGGDGSLAYNNSTGVLTYTGPSAAEVRAHFSGGTGVTYTSGTGAIAIGQAVGTTDSVTFGGLYVSGNLMVNGTTTTINSTTLTVDDKNIVLADGAADANAADSGGITIAGANAQLFYKSTTDAWNFNKDLAMGGNDVSGVGRLTATGAISTTDSAVFGGNGSTGGVKIDDGAITIRTGTGSVAAVDFYCEVNNAHRVRLKSPAHANYSGNPDVVLPTSSGTLALTSQIPTNNNTLTNGAGYITASSTETLTNKSGNISMFTNDANYLDSTTVTGVITQAYVNSLGITAGLDSALVSQLVDSSYVQLRQSGGAITVQEEGVSLATSATTLNFVGSNVTASGTGATKTITITGGSGGAGGSGISRADFFHYTATNGQTSFTGADDDGQTLSYTPARAAVYLNGILLRDSADYTSTSGDAIVLATGADSNDIITIVNQGGLDSSIVTTIVDSSYVAARAGGATGGTDSAAVLALIDSAHIISKIGSAATLTFTPDVKHARLSMSGDEGIDAGAWRKVDNLTVRDVDTSTGNALSDTSNARLVIPAGVTKVKVMAGLETTDVAGQVIAEIYHYNSSNSLQTTRTAKNDTDTSGGDTTVAYTSIVDVSQGDYFQLHAYCQDAGTIKATKYTYLEIEVVEGSILNTVIGSTIQLSDLSNVHTATPTNGQALVWDSANQYWEPGTVASSGGTDSAAVISLIDSSYIQARQSTVSAGATTISTTSFTATDNQTTFATDYTVGKINTYLNGVLLVDSADYTASNGSSIVLSTGADSNDILQVVKYTTAAIAGGLDSALTTQLIDSAYITARAGAGTDSAAVISLIDSSYVQARQTAGRITADIFSYTASNAQTAFSGTDNNNKTLAYTPDNVNVFLNGILLVDSDDYTATSGSLVTLVSAASAGDNIQITGYSATGNAARETAFSTFTYTADSGQTAFTGASEEGTSLQYTSRAQIYLNGILLKDSDDYTRTSSSTLTLTEAADSSDIIQIHDFSDVRVSSNLINKNYEYTADSGQTTFSGPDNNSATLSYQSGYIQVFLNGILLREADYTASNGSSVVLAEAADSGNTLTISKYGYGTTNPSTVATWTERSTTATAVAGEKLFIDCSSGVVTVTLPSSPDMGSEIRVIDATGNAATNNITIGRNGSKINGADSDLTLDVNRAAIGLVYYNAAQGWILMER